MLMVFALPVFPMSPMAIAELDNKAPDKAVTKTALRNFFLFFMFICSLTFYFALVQC
jgi:hypothetical protein